MTGPPAARRNRALTSIDLGNVQLGDAGCAGQAHSTSGYRCAAYCAFDSMRCISCIGLLEAIDGGLPLVELGHV